MKRVTLVVLAVAVVVTSCTPRPTPTPTQPPPASPTATPTPSLPAGAYDCAHPPALSGLVTVAHPIEGRFVVVLRQARTAAQLGADARSMADRFGGSSVRTFSRSVSAFSASFAMARALELARDPAVAYVQQEGRKFIRQDVATTIFLAAAADASATARPTWGLDRVDQRDLPLDGAYAPGVTGA